MKSPIKFKLKDGMDEIGKKMSIPQKTVFLKEAYLQKMFFSGKIPFEQYNLIKKVLDTIQQ